MQCVVFLTILTVSFFFLFYHLKHNIFEMLVQFRSNFTNTFCGHLTSLSGNKIILIFNLLNIHKQLTTPQCDSIRVKRKSGESHHIDIKISETLKL